eukprot:CAMPEP_0175045250 /NCGR_PEP_ID=MMETSP0052_2-20121109/4299_1 /TAXON_ID=51329 ORGANISM="Polytomella parva, Strain SAG 63-3" /NCGR_SAMPLE_ID=MMETSP0052_2 /ASSEMBLY_ACC=CAM_ASM_000194 /LENGTH=457 /DNA_ID=CAMNT_0016308721 /DNA_START=334 /DNA_END=1707 /DNA_ORIENTATION=+
MVMEYANRDTLLKHINRQPQKRLSEEDSRWLFQQLIFGLDYCHQKTVANRDLKLENLLLSQDPSNPDNLLLKIADFGLAIATQISNPKSRVGTFNYMAPEILRNSDEQTYDGVSADVWSCGVILYAMLFGRYPFSKQSSGNMVDAIKNARYTLPSNIPISQPCQDLLRSILVVDPSKRPTVQDILRSEWCGTNLPESVLTMNAGLVEDQQQADFGQSIEEVEQILGLGLHAPIDTSPVEDPDEDPRFLAKHRRPRPNAREIVEYEAAATEVTPEDMGLDNVGEGGGPQRIRNRSPHHPTVQPVHPAMAIISNNHNNHHHHHQRANHGDNYLNYTQNNTNATNNTTNNTGMCIYGNDIERRDERGGDRIGHHGGYVMHGTAEEASMMGMRGDGDVMHLGGANEHRGHFPMNINPMIHAQHYQMQHFGGGGAIGEEEVMEGSTKKFQDIYGDQGGRVLN